MEIIAEIGKNFVTTEQPQPLDVLVFRAKELILAAQNAGAKIVKFQVHTVDDEVHPDTKIIAPHFKHDRYEWVKRNTYPVEFWREIKKFCEFVGVEFLATPMSRGAAELLNEEIGVERWKIGSGDILDFPMLDYIRDTGRPVILSSGMSLYEELQDSYEYLIEKTRDVSILHCVSLYPCALDDLNLATIPFLKKKFQTKIGFSDHSLEVSSGLFAKQLGAEIIEKHFTLDRSAWGPDHKVSLEPGEFAQFVKEINEDKVVEIPVEAMGIPAKAVANDELPFRSAFRKGLYAARDIEAGEIFEPDMLVALRPMIPESVSSEHYVNFLGKTNTETLKKNQKITYGNIT